jgi:hypothetical protein
MLSGDRQLISDMQAWLGLSPFAKRSRRLGKHAATRFNEGEIMVLRDSQFPGALAPNEVGAFERPIPVPKATGSKVRATAATPPAMTGAHDTAKGASVTALVSATSAIVSFLVPEKRQ